MKEQTETEGHASEPSNCFFLTITVLQLVYIVDDIYGRVPVDYYNILSTTPIDTGKHL